MTADRVAASLSSCLIDLLALLAEHGLLTAPKQVLEETCGRSGEKCRSQGCRRLCTLLKSRSYEVDETEVLLAMTELGLDLGEAAALLSALNLKHQGYQAVLLSSDGDARRAAARHGLEAHGDLYLIEVAKKLNLCSPREAANIALYLPRLGRHIADNLVREAAARLERQSGGL